MADKGHAELRLINSTFNTSFIVGGLCHFPEWISDEVNWDLNFLPPTSASSCVFRIPFVVGPCLCREEAWMLRMERAHRSASGLWCLGQVPVLCFQ